MFESHADTFGHVILSEENMSHLFRLAKAALIVQPLRESMAIRYDIEVDYPKAIQALLELTRRRYLKRNRRLVELACTRRPDTALIWDNMPGASDGMP